MSLKVPCPHCKTEVIWRSGSSYRPFCSERCQLIDLGDWAEENHKISKPSASPISFSEEMLDALESQFATADNFFLEPE